MKKAILLAALLLSACDTVPVRTDARVPADAPGASSCVSWCLGGVPGCLFAPPSNLCEEDPDNCTQLGVCEYHCDLSAQITVGADAADCVDEVASVLTCRGRSESHGMCSCGSMNTRDVARVCLSDFCGGGLGTGYTVCDFDLYLY